MDVLPVGCCVHVHWLVSMCLLCVHVGGCVCVRVGDMLFWLCVFAHVIGLKMAHACCDRAGICVCLCVCVFFYVCVCVGGCLYHVAS